MKGGNGNIKTLDEYRDILSVSTAIFLVCIPNTRLPAQEDVSHEEGENAERL